MTPLERAGHALYLREPQTIDRFSRDCSDPKSLPVHTIHAVPWSDLDDDEKSPYVEAARAVLHAIREPSDGMVEAAHLARPDVIGSWRSLAREQWAIMIDAALEEAPTGAK